MNSAVARYLPDLLREWQLHNRATEHTVTQHSRILLFADASGFTVLTRNLSLQGRVGFEHLTDLLNNLFDSLAEDIARHNGDILKFSGDAVWCCFPENTDILQVYAEMLSTIEAINREQPVCRQFPLSMHAGATRGTLDLLTVSAANGRAEFEISGASILAAYRACDLAKAGELCVTADFASSLSSREEVRREQDFVIIRPQPKTVALCDRYTFLPDESSLVDESLVKYVPEALRERILSTSKESTLDSEHRQVYVAFVNVQPLPENSDTASLQNHLAKIMNAIHDSGGTVARIDPFGSGHKVLALFGAIIATGNDAQRALKAAVEIAAIESAVFVNRIGLTAGPLLCGEVGSQRRREFTVMGNAVNLAARLMTKSEPSGLLLDEQFHQAVANSCKTHPLQLSLKGFDLPVTVYAFDSLREHHSKLRRPRQFFGRVAELESLRSALTRSASAGPIWQAISGPAGIGKTSLVAVAVENVASDKIIYLDASDSHLRHGGWLIYELLLQSFCIKSANEFLDQATDHLGRQWLPLMESIAGMPISGDCSLSDLTPELRASKTAELVSSCLEQSLNGKVLILDNLESLDTLSTSILRALISRLSSCRSLVLLLDDDDRWSDAGPNVTALSVEGLPETVICSWLETVFVRGKRESDLESHLIAASAGSPLIVEETLQYLIRSKAIAHVSEEARFDVVAAVGEIALSGRLEELQLARFDQLPEEHRNLLKAASVFPHTFTAADLALLKSDLETEYIESALDLLCRADLLVSNRRTDSPFAQYRFCRSILRETIYNRAPVLQLQNWHSRVADSLLQVDSEDNVQSLAHHLAKSNRAVEAFHFNLKAAICAIDASLPLPAAGYFRECEACLQSPQATTIPLSDRLDFFRRASDFYIAEGNYHQALMVVKLWRRQAKAAANQSEHHAAANRLAQILWKQSRYVSCRIALDFIEREFRSSENALLTDSYALRGELQRRTGKIKEAQESCRQAVAFAETVGDHPRLAHSLNNLGLACWTGGNLDEASQCFEKCLNLHEAKNSRYLGARIANNLAIISEERGDYIRARELANRALDAFADFGDRRNQSYASGNLANLLVHAGRLRQATELFTTADRIFIHLGETHPHFYTVGNLGDIDLVLGRLAEAKNKYQAVLDFARSAGDKELEAETAVRLTECAFYGGENAEIEALYRTAIATAQEAGSLEYQTRATVGLSRYLIGIRDVNLARTQIGQLRAFAAEAKSQRTQNESEFLQGEIERIAGSPALAISAYQRCCEYARNQEQFELRLKSLVRLTEVDGARAETRRDELALLLKDFAGWNGLPLLNELLSSNYYRYFRSTLIDAWKTVNIGAAQHSIG